MKIEPIRNFKKRFRREWLLVAVDKVNRATSEPLSGRLIAHSPRREEIYQLLTKPLKSKKLFLGYSEDDFPKGFAAAF